MEVCYLIVKEGRMLLFPAKTKFKKSHKQSRKLCRIDANYDQPTLGFCGLKALKTLRLKSSQILTAKKLILRNLKKNIKARVKLRIVCFPDLPVTKKSAGIRMGKGKGNVDFWCFLVRKGRVLFEFSCHGIPTMVVFNVFLPVTRRLPGDYSILL